MPLHRCVERMLACRLSPHRSAHVLVDPVLDVSERRAIWRVGQLIVRVNAEQMQHDQFARCRILECLLEQRERAPPSIDWLDRPGVLLIV